LRFRGAGDRRLAARRDVCGDADSPEDPRGDGAVRRGRRRRRREPGRRLSPPARPARPAAVELRLRRDRDRRSGAVQPVRRRRGCVPAQRPAERGLHTAGRGFSIRAGRRHAGADSLLGARLRAARAVPDPARAAYAAAGCGGGGGGGDVNNSILVVVLASAVLYGTPLLFAALGELLAERSGVLNLGVEGMMLVGAVMGFWAVQRTSSLALALVVAAIAG